MNARDRDRQRGVVLIVSLLILLMLSIIGISAISNTALEERMSNNFQKDMMAFQASESAINQIILKGDEDSSFYSSVRDATTNISADPLQAAMDAGLNTTTTSIAYDADPNNIVHGADLQTVATVSFQGEASGDCNTGNSVDTVVCQRYELSANTTLSGTTTGPTHIQRILRSAPVN